MAVNVDDKSDLCIPFILEHLAQHRQNSDRPFFVGLNGVQGAGKTTLVDTLISTLSKPPYSLPTIALSIDDLYLPHGELQALARNNPSNPLLQHRGQPSTHDVALGRSVFEALQQRQPSIKIPSYDKSLHNGQGDRAPEDTWVAVNQPGQKSIDVVLFEGWCVGFRALSEEELEQTWSRAKGNLSQAFDESDVRAKGRLGRQILSNLQTVNNALKTYDVLTDQLQAFIQIDAEDTDYVYEWRLEQEAALRAAKGRGMTDEQVINFVNGYYPAYELFLEKLRRCIFPTRKGHQLRMIVGKDRKVLNHYII